MTSDAVIIPNPEGLHARPAAVLSSLAQKYESDIRLKRGDDHANAKSVMAVMGFEVLKGNKVQVIARGPDAAQAAEELARPSGWPGGGGAVPSRRPRRPRSGSSRPSAVRGPTS